MAWTPTFSAALGESIVRLELRVGTTGTAHMLIAPQTWSETWRAGRAEIVQGGLELEGEDLSLPDVSTTHGGFTVRLLGSALATTADRVRPGVILEVNAALPAVGKVGATFERLAVGVVESVGAPGSGEVEIVAQGLGALLGGRLDTTTTDPALFASAGTVLTQVDASYAPGDTTITVVDTSGWADLDNYGIYYLRVGSNILRATGRTATTFTGVTGGRLGTTDASASAADDVEMIACLYGHPIEETYKLLTSTGLGTNGPNDVLPQDWGLAMPSALVDRTTVDVLRTALGIGSWEVEMWSDAPVSNPLAWLEGYLAPLGFFVTLRQGQIAVRAVPKMTTWPVFADIVETDWIADEPPDLEIYDTQDSVEYGTWRALNTVGTVISVLVEAIRTVPAERYADVTLEGLYENQVSTAVEIEARTATWYTRRSGLITGTLAGLRWAALAPGDVVTVTHSRFRQDDGTAFTSVRCLVLSAVPAYDDARVAVTLKVPGTA